MSKPAVDFPSELTHIKPSGNYLVRVTDVKDLEVSTKNGKPPSVLVKLELEKKKQKSKPDAHQSPEGLNFWTNTWDRDSLAKLSVWDAGKRGTFFGQITVSFPSDPCGWVKIDQALAADPRHRGDELKGRVSVILVNYPTKEKHDDIEMQVMAVKHEKKKLEVQNAKQDQKIQELNAKIKSLQKIADASVDHRVEEDKLRHARLTDTLEAVQAAMDEKKQMKAKLMKLEEQYKEAQIALQEMKVQGHVIVGSDRVQKKWSESLQRETKLKQQLDDLKARNQMQEKRLQSLQAKTDALEGAGVSTEMEDLWDKYKTLLDDKQTQKIEVAQYEATKFREKDLKKRVIKLENEKSSLAISREKLNSEVMKLGEKMKMSAKTEQEKQSKISALERQIEELEEEKDMYKKKMEEGPCKNVCMTQ